MTAPQAHARGFGRLRGFFGRKAAKEMSRKDMFTAALGNFGYQSYMVMPGQPVWMDRNYYQFALEAYIKNVIAHRAMGMVSGAASSVRFKLYECDADGVRTEIKQHPVLDIMHHPNPAQAHGEFFQALYQYRLISGNAFIQAVGPADAPPRELHLLRPDRMAVIAGIGMMPAGYRYTVNGDYTDYPVDRVTGRSHILHMKNFHPLNDWYGLSPIEAAAYSIDQHNQAGAWNQALLQNGARPSGALVVRADATGSGTLSEDQYNRIKLQIDDQFSGAANAGRPLLLEGGLDWKEMSISPKDMDFVQAKNASARDIALAFGVPPQMLGIPGDNTYSNLQEARLALWEQTVIPLLKSTADALNGWLLPLFGSHLELAPDLDNIPALALKNQAIWDRVQVAGFLTLNEKRAAVGYGPLLPQPQAKNKIKRSIPRREIKVGTRRAVKDDGGDDDGGDDGGGSSADGQNGNTLPGNGGNSPVNGDTAPDNSNSLSDNANGNALSNYNPDEPRVPAGEPGDGEWTSGGDTGSGQVMDDAGNLYPSNDPSLAKPDGIPDDWITSPAKKGIGVRYTDPNNDSNEVRIMLGDPDSDFPVQQSSYVRWMNNGKWLDVNGNATSDLGEAHIPLEDFEFMPEVFP